MRYRGFHDDLRAARADARISEKRTAHVRGIQNQRLLALLRAYADYNANPIVAPPGGSMSQEDVRAIVAYAKRLHIEVVPEQEAFGHLHHVLKYDLYSALGETDHGHVLAPNDPASVPLIKSWFAEIDSLFRRRWFTSAQTNIRARPRPHQEQVTSSGLGQVYIDFLKQIESVLRSPGKRFLFWATSPRHPGAGEVIPKDMLAVGWGYGSNPRAKLCCAHSSMLESRRGSRQV